MTKRKYTNMQALEPQILVMKEQGLTNREIAEALGLERSRIRELSNQVQRFAVINLVRYPVAQTFPRLMI